MRDMTALGFWLGCSDGSVNPTETRPEKRNFTRAVTGRERTAPPPNTEDGREVYITDHWGLEARKDVHVRVEEISTFIRSQNKETRSSL